MKTLTRRAFLQSTALSSATIFGGAACANIAAKPSSAKNTIIDTHTHFYDPSRPQGVPWPGKNDTALYRTVLPKHYRALPQPRAVTGTVVVEASPWVEDNQWILDLAATDPFIVGLVGNLPEDSAEYRKHLKRFARNRLFRGIRISQTRLAKALQTPSLLRDLALLAEYNLELDVNGGPTMLPDIARLAQAVPQLRIVINHVANVRIDGQTPPVEWLRDMAACARHERVFCKVSALVEGSGHSDGSAPTNVDYYRPVLDTVWQAFGSERLIYGSNWPVSERFASCATVQKIVLNYFSSKGDVALENFFWKNASKAYQWVPRRVS